MLLAFRVSQCINCQKLIEKIAQHPQVSDRFGVSPQYVLPSVPYLEVRPRPYRRLTRPS
jgi:hypothetical protein